MSVCVLDGPDQCGTVARAILQISICEMINMAITFRQILVWDDYRQNSSSVRHVIAARIWGHRMIAGPTN